jgi:hypothetical protein
MKWFLVSVLFGKWTSYLLYEEVLLESMKWLLVSVLFWTRQINFHASNIQITRPDHWFSIIQFLINIFRCIQKSYQPITQNCNLEMTSSHFRQIVLSTYFQVPSHRCIPHFRTPFQSFQFHTSVWNVGIYHIIIDQFERDKSTFVIHGQDTIIFRPFREPFESILDVQWFDARKYSNACISFLRT